MPHELDEDRGSSGDGAGSQSGRGGRSRCGRSHNEQARAGLLDQLVGYIPGDALSVFVALTAFALDARWWWRLIALVGVGALTPIWVVMQYRDAAGTQEALRVWPWFQMIVGTLAFVAWSTSVPGAVWQNDLDLSADAGGAIAVGAAAAIGVAVRYWRQQHRVAKNPPTPPAIAPPAEQGT